MNKIVPGDIHCAHYQRVSMAEWKALPDRAQAEFDRRSREWLANFIQDKKVETTVHEDYVEKRIDLYVATPAEFWACVHREAETLAQRYYR